jgi:hypothetical protein
MSESASPFAKHLDERFEKFGPELSSFEKAYEYLKDKSIDAFVAFLPSDDIKEMPPVY